MQEYICIDDTLSSPSFCPSSSSTIHSFLTKPRYSYNVTTIIPIIPTITQAPLTAAFNSDAAAPSNGTGAVGVGADGTEVFDGTDVFDGTFEELDPFNSLTAGGVPPGDGVVQVAADLGDVVGTRAALKGAAGDGGGVECWGGGLVRISKLCLGVRKSRVRDEVDGG